jgi:tetratricopeptide (TPR) repeat protein
MDEAVARRSAAMHSYLVGQLDYGKEDFKGALQNFSRAGELVAEPVPILNAKLAELHVRAGQLEEALVESLRARKADPESESIALLHAGILEALERPAEAEVVYQEILKLHPDANEAYILLASLYAKRGADSLALATLKTLVSRAPREPIGHYYLGRYFEAAGKTSDAEQSFERAVSLSPENVSLRIDLVRLALKNKKFDRARELCTQILEREPNNVVARRVLGQLLIGENKLDEALKHLQVLETVEDDSSETRFKIAVIQMEKKNFPEAIRALNLLLAKSPRHSAARYYLASIYAGSGRRKEAVEELAKLERGDEMFIKGRMFAAFIQRQEGDLEGAEQSAREAYDVDPTNKSVASYLVLVLRERKRYAAALDVLTAATERDPTDDKALFNYGVVLADLERKEEAIRVMERVLALSPTYGDALNYVAYHLAEQGRDLARAEELAKRALGTSPNDGYYLDTLGWVYFKQGRFADAEETLARAVAVSGRDVVIVEHYGDALRSNAKEAQALETYRSALELELESNKRLETEVARRIRGKIADIIAANPRLNDRGLLGR